MTGSDMRKMCALNFAPGLATAVNDMNAIRKYALTYEIFIKKFGFKNKVNKSGLALNVKLINIMDKTIPLPIAK